MRSKTLFALCLVVQSLAWAGIEELDNPTNNKAGANLQGTVVLRVDERTGEMAMLKTPQAVASQDEALALANENYAPVPQAKVSNELDNEAGASSWYWYYPGFSFGYSYSFYYYGNCYNPWYNYYSWPYRYYYYGYY